MGRRGSVIHTARGLVYAEPVTDALGLINGVDLAVTYDVSVSGRQLAVSALTLLPGATITAADLTEAVANMPVGLGPDIVHVCPKMTLSATYRPTVSALRAAGIPKSARQAWYFDAGSNEFRRLTPAAPCGADRGEQSAPMLDDSLLSILVCPADRGPLMLVDQTMLYNPRLRRAYRIDDGIPVLLIDEARDVDDDDEHARFTAARPLRQIPGEVALQVRRDGLRDLLGRQRRERLDLHDVASHDHAHQLRRDELDADPARARGIVNARSDFRDDNFLQERASQIHLAAEQQRPQRRDQSRSHFRIPDRQQHRR